MRYNTVVDYRRQSDVAYPEWFVGKLEYEYHKSIQEEERCGYFPVRVASTDPLMVVSTA